MFYVQAEKNGQRSVVKPDEMAWNLSAFETGGQEVRLTDLSSHGSYVPKRALSNTQTRH